MSGSIGQWCCTHSPFLRMFCFCVKLFLSLSRYSWFHPVPGGPARSRWFQLIPAVPGGSSQFLVLVCTQRKAFYRQKIPGSSCARKETVDIDTLVTSRNGDRKVMESIRITSRPPSRIREVEPAEQVQMNIYQSNAYRKNLSWLHFNNEPRTQDRQQVKD